MAAFNVVRMKLKPGEEDAFVAFHRGRDISAFKGMKSFHLVKTGDGEFVVIGEWEDIDALIAARPQMIATLDGVRDKLEDLGGGLGLTDPRSGTAVVSLGV
ncbi:antibiotic biosynthesis monooxygenase family protein [Actibacterium sp. MT2.3-13A]|uniref:antibiotic biosynthesis monooxygenase family protein n=1 Tax=Actibacterium sp. MT2.3-13A TaxID=2828332 RepID=UPI001BA60FF5|nr:antibiotic biosynthesis monooxygenase family protein [Actibacterium sp. MT2.3-13A]